VMVTLIDSTGCEEFQILECTSWLFLLEVFFIKKSNLG
jgi:hypothetical protein